MIGARPALPADRSCIVELAQLARSTVADQRGGASLLSTSVPAGEAHDHATSVWCGLIGDAIVGYGLVTVRSTRAEITEFFVEPDARGVGVGDALLTSITSWSEAAGCTDLDASALPGDRATKNFFEAHRMTSRLLVVSRRLAGAIDA